MRRHTKIGEPKLKTNYKTKTVGNQPVKPVGQSSTGYNPLIAQVQQRLYELGYNDVLVKTSRKKDGTWDGILGEGTMATIKKFQADKGLPQTGYPDDATLIALGLKPTPPIVPDKTKIIEWLKRNSLWIGIVLVVITLISLLKKTKKEG